MPQIVEIPGQGQVEFPDGMSDADIAAAIQKITVPAPAPLRPTLKPVSLGPEPSRLDAAVIGGEQGLSAGFSDEIKGVRNVLRRSGAAAKAMASIVPGLSGATPEEALARVQELKDLPVGEQLKREVVGDPTGPTLSGLVTGGEAEGPGKWYRTARDADRAKQGELQQAHPGTYLLSEIAGAVAGGGRGLVGKGTSLMKRLALGAGQGGIQGAGFSDATDAAGVARDTVVGSGVGLVGNAIGEGLGRAASWAKRKGSELIARGTGRAAEQAAEEGTAAVRSLEGAARERAANAYRQMERIQLALNDPALPQAERAALEAFKKSPEYASLVAANARGVLGAAPDALAEREAAAAIAQSARASLPSDIAGRTKELLTPQVKADAKSFLKSYAEPVVWATLAYKAADAAGLDPEQRAALAGVAGLVGGRTRAGKALWNRLSRPAHEVAIGKVLSRAGTAGQGAGAQLLQRLAARGVPAAATAGLVATPASVAADER